MTETEANQDGYVTSDSGNTTGTIEGKAEPVEVVFTNKKDGENKPEAKTGSLTVSKTVSGSRGDESKDWSFTVTLSDKTINGVYGGM